MKNDNDMDLFRAFDEIREPSPDEAFTERVSKKIASRRRTRQIMIILLSIAGALIFAVLTPRLINFTGHIALISNLLAYSAAALLLSPAGYIIGGGVGLFFFLKTRA